MALAKNKNTEQNNTNPSLLERTRARYGQLKHLVKVGHKPAAWLVETLMRSIAGFIILTNFSNFIAIAIGIYFASTATILVISAFARAYTQQENN